MHQVNVNELEKGKLYPLWQAGGSGTGNENYKWVIFIEEDVNTGLLVVFDRDNNKNIFKKWQENAEMIVVYNTDRKNQNRSIGKKNEIL